MPIKVEDLPYRSCAGIMVLNSEGFVWAGHRIRKGNSEYDSFSQFWQMPQGGIDGGEKPLTAAIRELYEETGIKTVTLLAEGRDWLHYDLPAELIGIGLRGKYRGQAQRWFAFRFDGDDSEIQINPPPAGHLAEFDSWDWKPMESLPELIVPFKRTIYEKVIAEFRHLSGR